MNYRGSFRDFLDSRPKALEKGYYSRYLKKYLQYFDRTQMLALVFEDVFDDVAGAKVTIADFLEIEPEKFPASVARSKVNASTVPSHQSLYGFVVKTGRQLRRRKLEPLVDLVMRLGIQRIMSKGNALQPLDRELRDRLSRLYEDEFEELENCMQIDLSSWREAGTASREQTEAGIVT